MERIYEQISQCKIIPVVALSKVEYAQPLAEALYKGGLPCAEVTFRHKGADECIRIMRKCYPQMLIGAGTVLTKEQVDAAVEAGAEFIVSPGLNPEIVSYCMQKGIIIIPGCSSPSDIEKALEMGLTYVKFFPAEALGGIKMLKALSAPYSMMKFMPTGGITADNMEQYLSLPNVFACGGSFMVPGKYMESGDFDSILKLTQQTVRKLQRTDENTDDNNSSKRADLTKITNKRVVTFGELMLRLAPEGYLRFLQADALQATFGGGEANVAVSLANFGTDVSFVTKLPTHEIGQAAVNSLRRFGVDTTHIIRGGERIGIYYLEKGASQRPSKVIYDRAGSSIACVDGSEFDWDAIFSGVGWFHFTGITPALSDALASICLQACLIAREKGIVISCDLNYRNKLWSRERAGQVMSKLCEYVDVCIANEEDAADVFRIHATGTDVAGGKLNDEGYQDVAEQLVSRFGFSRVAITLRESHSANDNRWGAMLYDGKDCYFSKKYDVHIVDRVGGGDSFGAGLIYAMMNGYGPKESIEFAVAASCLKHSVEGDYNMATVEEVRKLAEGDGSGRVQR